MNAPRSVWRLAAIGLACSCGVPGAQEAATAVFEADSLSLDRGSNTAVLKNIRITDGDVLLTANEGKRVAGSERTGEWSLNGQVVITVDAAVARADTATLRFSDGRLVSSELIGNPVELEKPGENAFRGAANRLAYDGEGGVFSATGDAWFAYGQQEFRCNWTYDVEQGAAAGFADDDQKCRLVIEVGR